MDVLLIGIGSVLAVFNLAQVVAGRQLVGRSERTPEQLRRESIGAAVAMAGVALVGVGALASVTAVSAIGIVLVVAGMGSIALRRSR